MAKKGSSKMEKGLKNFIEFINRHYGIVLKHPDDFDAVYKKVGAVFYSPPKDECFAVIDFFRKSIFFQFVGFDMSRMIIRKLSRACSGTGKNKVYLKSDHTFTKDYLKAMYAEDDSIRKTIKNLKKKKPVFYKKLKMDYEF
jgi:hypothetical protein